MSFGHHVLRESAVQIATETQAVSYSEVASVALLTWDIIVTMSDEVELIWKKAWTPAKGMYVFARYLPWAFQVALLGINIDGSVGLHYTLAQCRRWMAVQAIMLQLIVTAVDAILITRVYALYNKNPKLLAVLGVLFGAELVVLAYVLAQVTPRLTFNDDCFVTSSPPLFVAYWITSLVFETVLFVLTLLKFVEAVRRGWGRRPVMRDFVSDGTWAYTLIFVTMLINSMLYKYVRSPLAGVCFTWLLTVLSFAGSRLVLNPRRRSEEYRTSISLSAHNARSHALSFELVSIPLSPLSGSSPPSSPRSCYDPARYSSTFSPASPVAPTYTIKQMLRNAPPAAASGRVRVRGLDADVGFEDVGKKEEDEMTLVNNRDPTSTVYTLNKCGVAL